MEWNQIKMIYKLVILRNLQMLLYWAKRLKKLMKKIKLRMEN